MKKFIYAEISKRKTIHDIEYACDGMRAYSLLDILEKIGDDGWELVGEIEGKLIVKKEYNV